MSRQGMPGVREALRRTVAVRREVITMMPDVQQIMDYEAGELDIDAEIELFQHLVDSGMAWMLQGHYGRTAEAMIEAGVVHLPVGYHHMPDWE
jgi:hypothetical protein